jgi:K+-sensing histidine kinase KdpD
VSDQAGKTGDPARAGFLGFVAHEVRNPLSTALWSAELLTRMPAGERSGSRGERLSAMCLRSIARVRQLVEDHLLCERLDVGGIPLRPEPVLLREALDAVLSKSDAATTIDVPADARAAADRPLLERALDALIAAASAEKSPVRITSAAARAGAIALSVQGHAPAADALADPTKGSPGDARGRALALPLARRIAAALGGALAVADGGYVLSLPAPEAYSARPTSAAPPR